MSKLGFITSLVILNFLYCVESKCIKGCNLALGSYYILPGETLLEISNNFNVSIDYILNYNPQIPNANSLQMNSRIIIPFSCDCLDQGLFLGHVFEYSIQSNDNLSSVAQSTYANLTTVSLLQKFNGLGGNNGSSGLFVGGKLNVTVECFCGDETVSNDYGLFNSYPLQESDSLSYIAHITNLSGSLLQRYNPGVDFNGGSGLVFLPWRDANGSYRPLRSESRKSGSASPGFTGIVVGISIAVVIGLAFSSLCWYLGHKRRKEAKEVLLCDKPEYQPTDTTGQPGDASVLPGITVDKSVEFSYEELANATNNFSISNKIGQGGYGAVYYAELRGEKSAIKKMDMQATKEFLAELNVLSHVHHLNLVRLIGYCVDRSLFLVYEFIENGTLSQHLRNSGKASVPWSTRVQIALDSARGIEYIHEHTVPVYIHRDIKSANILLDNDFHAKVADFGLTKLAEVGNGSLPTGLVGTFGYMPPEYAHFGDVSPKIDVFAFGVVLFEIISGKPAVLSEHGSTNQSKGLATLFEEVLSDADPNSICHLVDPRLGEDYPLDSVIKMAELGRECTQDNPELRPSIRHVVVALNSLSSLSHDLNIGTFNEHSRSNLMFGR